MRNKVIDHIRKANTKKNESRNPWCRHPFFPETTKSLKKSGVYLIAPSIISKTNSLESDAVLLWVWKASRRSLQKQVFQKPLFTFINSVKDVFATKFASSTINGVRYLSKEHSKLSRFETNLCRSATLFPEADITIRIVNFTNRDSYISIVTKGTIKTLIIFIAWIVWLLLPKGTNFIIFYMDDLGWADTSHQISWNWRFKKWFPRNSKCGRLAKQGMTFSQGCSLAPTCTPSRISIHYGKTNARLGYTTVRVLANNRR